MFYFTQIIKYIWFYTNKATALPDKSFSMGWDTAGDTIGPVLHGGSGGIDSILGYWHL